MHVKLPTSEIQHLTCTVDTISSVTRVTGAGVTPHCVSALCILMTVVQVINLTLVKICMKHKKHNVQDWHILLSSFVKLIC